MYRSGGSFADAASVEGMKLEETSLGTWRRYVYPGGRSRLSEFRSHAEIFGLPLVHFTTGIDPVSGRKAAARGILAVGRRAIGVIAVGQVSIGVLAIGQAALGVAALGQAAGGMWAIGQLAVGWRFALGQIAIGAVAIGQLAAGRMVLAQIGLGRHVSSTSSSDPEAVAFFRSIWKGVSGALGL